MASAAQGLVEGVLSADRFNMNRLYTDAWPAIVADLDLAAAIKTIEDEIGVAQRRRIEEAVIRNAFLIELVVQPGVTTTRVTSRWTPALADDPRRASFEDCLVIANGLLRNLPDWLAEPKHLELTRLMVTASLLPYEAPIDYQVRLGKDDLSERIHTAANLGWTYSDEMLAALELREFLLNPESSPDAGFFRGVLTDKIKVKAYLTDRAQTGLYKTNREKRWEAHPASVQFALRRTCLEIERALVVQICSFKGFPPESAAALQGTGALPVQLVDFRCPITLDPISYEDFRSELMNPTHGKSDFQVGHLNPLKLGDPAGDAIGHSAENISWVSADGNRIQGSLSADETQALLRRIARNYEDTGAI